MQVVLLFTFVFILSSSNWLSFWVGMELMSLLILPLLGSMGWKGISFSLWQLMLTQITASSLFLMSIMSLPKLEIMDTSWCMMMMSSMLFMVVILMKMGMFPFHGWMLELSEGLTWMSLYWILSLLKVVPIYLSMLVMPLFSESLKIMFSVILIFSMLITALNANVMLVRRILIYSSMTSAGWGLHATMFNQSLCVMFFLVYFTSLYFLVNRFSYSRFSSIQDLILMPPSTEGKLLISICLANMAGLPPFIGFYLKLSILKYILCYSTLLGVVATFSSLVFVMAYVKLYMAYFLKSVNVTGITSPFKEATSSKLSLIVLTALSLPYILF